MKKLDLVLFVILLCSVGSLSAQRTCNHSHHMEQLLQNSDYSQEHNERQQRFDAIYDITSLEERAQCANPVTLPMAIHFQGISNPDAACLIALAQSQVQILNDDYAGTNSDISTWNNNAASFFTGASNGETCINFCLATANHPTGFGLVEGQPAVTINAFTGDNNANFSGYINIFVREIGGGILGYSPLGGSGNGDGVVIDDQAFGSGSGCGVVAPGSPFNLGRTLTHELGHYLNLNHMWGGGNPSCNADDGVADTPNSGVQNYGCPSLGAQSCSTNDMHMNYMDYTNDACMYMFSAGQSTRMENYVAANLQNVANNAANVCSAAVPTCSDGLQNGNETGVDCGGDCDDCVTCSDNIQNGDETGVDCGGSSCAACPCVDNVVTLVIAFDGYPNEISWDVTDANGTVVAFAAADATNTYANLTETIDLCLEDACFDFTIYDSYGDGLYDGQTTGSYTLTNANGDTLVTGSGAFGSSATANFCLTTSGVCTPPANYAVDVPTTTSASFTWDAVAGATKYQVKYRLKGATAWLTQSSTGLQRTISGLTAKKYYQYKLRTECGTGTWSDFTDIELFYTSTCDAPTGVASIYLDNTRMRVRWDANPDEIKGKIRYRAVGGSSWTTQNSADGNNFLYVNDLPANATIQYKVRSNCDGNDWSAYSALYTHDLSTATRSDQSALVKLYPNPAKEVLNVQLNAVGDAQISISDISGRLVLNQNVNITEAGQTEILDISKLVEGYHILTIQTNEGIVSEKFVVVK
jgi:hypothetical protein